jgi:SAM-dependent methyltransferase
MNAEPALASLVDSASAPYRAAGRFAWHFARAKLRGDPVFAALLAQGLLAGRARVLDLGCGQGLLAAWLLAARALEAAGAWPRAWPPAPQPEKLLGVEIQPREVQRAHLAFGAQAQFVLGDIRHVDYGACDAIVMLDVLHYTDYAAQEAALARARAALAPGGLLLLRVGDADGGTRFALGQAVDRIVALARRGRLLRLWCRPLREWLDLLERLGFRARAVPMSAGTPFANFLLIGEVP